MGRRLLERLQQGVEGALGQHVHLVDEEHLEARGERHVGGLVPQPSHVIDARVRRGVDLDQVCFGPRVIGLAPCAGPAGIIRGPLLAVQRLGEEPRGGGLARPSGAEEQVSVPDTVLGDRSPQGAGHHVLPRDLSEGSRAVLSSEDEVGHQGERRAGAGPQDNGWRPIPSSLEPTEPQMIRIRAPRGGPWLRGRREDSAAEVGGRSRGDPPPRSRALPRAGCAVPPLRRSREAAEQAPSRREDRARRRARAPRA